MNEKNISDKKRQMLVGIVAKGLKDGLPEQEIVEKLIRNDMTESQARALVTKVKGILDEMINNAKEL